MAAARPVIRRFLSLVARPVRVSATVAVALSCHSDVPTEVGGLGGVSLAKGGGGSAGGASPTVTSTNPASAHQDTTIDVSIFGSGFTTGAKATWSLGGDTTKVHVKSTKVVSSGEILARIEVPATAPVASYDVVVTLSNGKKGVGAEKFEVLEGNPNAAFWFPLDDATLDVRSDHLYVSGTSSIYGAGVCGVHSKVFATENSTGDAIVDTDNPRYADKKCPAYPRRITVVFGPGEVSTSGRFINVRHIQNTTYQMPIGATVRTVLSLREDRCEAVRWVAEMTDGTFVGGDSVNVTRVDASTWLVETQPYPANKAYCLKTGRLYHLNVRFKVVTDRPMP